MKIRAYPILISIVLVTSVLTIGLRGTTQQTTAYQTDSLQNAHSIQGVSLGKVLWSADFNATSWHLSAPDMTLARLQLNNSLELNVTFANQPIPEAVEVSRNANLSLDQNLVVFAQLAVSVGVHYGVRFSGMTPGGAPFDAWRETSELQHRPGRGSPENITANLASEAYLANGQTPVPGSIITRIWFYVEATPGTSGEFSMKVASLKSLSLQRTASDSHEISGTLEAVVIDLDLPSVSQNLFRAYVGFDILGTSNLQYTPFFMNGTSVLAQGFTYVQNRLTTYEIAVLLPNLAVGFPPFLPEANSTAVIIAAKAGEISFFKLDSLSFKFTSTPLMAEGVVDPNVARLTMIYYFLFLFVTPVAAVILLSRAFKSES